MGTGGNMQNTGRPRSGCGRFFGIAMCLTVLSLACRPLAAQTVDPPTPEVAAKSESPQLPDILPDAPVPVAEPASARDLGEPISSSSSLQPLAQNPTPPTAGISAAGAPAKRGNYSSSTERDLHVALGSTAVAMYAATAYYAIRAPKV